ncbi:GspH/FimT family pseudopilin [Psychromonas sp. 14N.309.X.WAT.B.A12]|uniref:GspH/FimT family pseudopilin n=1 Tax=unclassified Psychromonas TaxID=2614957 RepID=UPI0025AEFA19|nr:GspH/FimT family pseudopilin [Psychromonas sp. 14N.309.X.WAT.B.A12]MDN2662754.1 GspH/FimT family pseudopilin [Psychromonas sp. 14N.309.X.WAT.B.A12]
MNLFINSKEHQQGFTLIEMLITIAVAAILLSIVVPSFNSIIESSKERTTRDSLVSAIYSAKQQAQSERVNVYLCSSNDGESCADTTDWGSDWLIYQDDDSSGDLDEDDTIIANISSKTDAITSEIKEVKFTPTGHSLANTFKICSNTDNAVVYKMVLSRMGRITYEEASGDC